MIDQVPFRLASERARAQPLSAPRTSCLDHTFFVSVERLLDPTLEGKPVIVERAQVRETERSATDA